MDNDFKDFAGAYQIPSEKEMSRRLALMENLWKDFLRSEGEDGIQYHIHRQNLFEVIRRQDQRMYYFKVFHNLDFPCEYKYVAILCFWLITLKPFIVTDSSSGIYSAPNEMFALYLILSTIRSVFEVHSKKQKFEYPSVARIKDILYDFKYCSLSREALISFVETYADTYGVGIDFIQREKVKITQSLQKNKIFQLWEKYAPTI